jgi:hypothetical protein
MSTGNIDIAKSNDIANAIARQVGYDDAEDLKNAFSHKGGRYNIGYDKFAQEIVIVYISDNFVYRTGIKLKREEYNKLWVYGINRGK